MKEHIRTVFELKKYYKDPDKVTEKEAPKEEIDNSKKPSKVGKQQGIYQKVKTITETQKSIKQMKINELADEKPVSPSKANAPNLLEMEENAGSQIQNNDYNLLSVNMNIGNCNKVRRM